MHIVSTAPSPHVVTFRLGQEEYAFSSEGLRDAWTGPRPTRVPGAHSYFDGVLIWRGQLVSVLNVARRLGLPPGEADAVLVLDVAGELVAMRVDALVEEAPVALALDEPAPPAPSAAHLGRGRVGDRPVTLLDAPALLSPPGAPVAPFPAQVDRAHAREAAVARRGVKRA